MSSVSQPVPKVFFNRPLFLGTEPELVADAMENGTCYSKLCEDELKRMLGSEEVFLTPSCTAALEMVALLADISDDHEVIMPSFTFVSTANAFALRGARIAFVDINPDTMNIDEAQIESAITDRTKAIVPVHYNGVSCDMDTIMRIAERHSLIVIEDAAQGIGASYKDRPLGSIGHIGTISFDHMKNLSTGQGGLIAINDPSLVESAHIVRDKGTNRSQFLRGKVDRYQWTDKGSNYALSEISAAVLWAQLQEKDAVNGRRRHLHARYREALSPLIQAGRIEIQTIPSDCNHNGHIFFLKVADGHERAQLIDHLKGRGVTAVFHYVPLHSSRAGQRFGYFAGEDHWTTRESGRLLRLPMHFALSDEEQAHVINSLLSFFDMGAPA